MDKGYQDSKTSKTYLDFLDSADGQFRQKAMLEALLGHLPKNPDTRLLEAGSGMGWLANELNKTYKNLEAVDFSSVLIAEAKKRFPKINFQVQDLEKTLPFTGESFDVITASLVMQYVKNQAAVYSNFYKLLKKDGLLLVTVPNPFYAYPVGMWKRGILGRLLMQKPKLKLNSYGDILRADGKVNWESKVTPRYFATLSSQIKNALKAGFVLTDFEEILSATDSENFDQEYRLHRFPIFLLLAFKKTG